MKTEGGTDGVVYRTTGPIPPAGVRFWSAVFFLVHTAIGHSFVVHLSCQPLRAMDTGIIPPIPWLHEGDQTLGAIDQRGPSTLSPSGHWQPYFYPSTPLRTHFRGMAFGPRDTLVFASFLFFPFFFEQEDLADVFFFLVLVPQLLFVTPLRWGSPSPREGFACTLPIGSPPK